MKRSYADLSKTVSHALRHAPDAYGLELDPAGWVDVNDLLKALSESSAEWTEISESDLLEMIQRSAKKRHEIVAHRIRALYGHSVPQRVGRDNEEPPVLLYHGTDGAAAAEILCIGLKPMSRQYAHLSSDQNTAHEVGTRKDANPVILVVRAKEAFDAGVAFYRGNDNVWLADYVPAAFISVARSR